MEELTRKAISAALAGNWELALKINQEILNNQPQDVDALNRLAKAFVETGHMTKAKTIASKVVAIDPTNSIAKKLLDKWPLIKANGHANFTTPLSPHAFLEESGKTKVVELIHLGDPKLIASLDAGDEVKFLAYEHRVSVVTQDGKYIGRLPDDLASRLKRLIKAGNQYQVLIKCTSRTEVRVFIKETKGDGISFPVEHVDYVSFSQTEVIHKKRIDDEEPDVVEEEAN